MSETLRVGIDAGQLVRMAATFRAIGKDVSPAVARAVNHAGDKAKTAMTRALAPQAGLTRQVIVRALKVTKASGAKGTTSYAIRSWGGNISLMHFGARETRAGVSAAPLGHRMVFTGAFMKAGGFTKGRVAKPGWNGQVFRRAGGKTEGSKGTMDKFEKVKSGVYIPEQMVSGASAEAFRQVAATDLPARLEHELLRAVAAAR